MEWEMSGEVMWSVVEERGEERRGEERSGEERSGEEWSGVERSGVEWRGVERSGVEWSRVEWSGEEWRGVEWSGEEIYRGLDHSAGGQAMLPIQCQGVHIVRHSLPLLHLLYDRGHSQHLFERRA
jgi:hypothetical protein